MKLWIIGLFILFFRDAHAQIIDIADEEPRSHAPSRIDEDVGMKKTQTPPSPLEEGIFVKEADKDEAITTFLAGDSSTTPSANTPGGGVPRMSEEVLKLKPFFPVEIPWWERWWNSIVEVFS